MYNFFHKLGCFPTFGHFFFTHKRFLIHSYVTLVETRGGSLSGKEIFAARLNFCKEDNEKYLTSLGFLSTGVNTLCFFYYGPRLEILAVFWPIREKEKIILGCSNQPENWPVQGHW